MNTSESENMQDKAPGNLDSKYIINQLGSPLTKALAEIVQKQPLDPIEYLANWLYKYKENQLELEKEQEWQDSLLAAEEEKARKQACQEEERLLATQRHQEMLERQRLEKLKEEEEQAKRRQKAKEEIAKRNLQPREKDKCGQTALHHMAIHAGADFSELNKMAELLADRDLNYKTPRDLALQDGLEQNVAEIDKYIALLLTEGTIPPLRNLLLSGYEHIQPAIDLLPQLTDLPDSTQKFINSIPDIQEKHASIFKVVHDADEEAFEKLIETMPQLTTSKNKRGQSLLHVAVLCDNKEIIKQILDVTPDSVNAKDNANRTPLHYASALSESTSKILLQNNATDSAIDIMKKTPADYVQDPTEILKLKEEDGLGAVSEHSLLEGEAPVANAADGGSTVDNTEAMADDGDTDLDNPTTTVEEEIDVNTDDPEDEPNQ